ncbi:MAG: hypothetical protein ACRDJY_02630 [Thermoleophilaceae bacterium]
MPRWALLLLAVCAAALVGVIAVAAADERKLAFTLGVRSTGSIIVIPPDGVACQERIGVPAEFATVSFELGTYFKPGPAIDVEVRRTGSGEVLAQGALAAGYPDNQRHLVDIGAVGDEQFVDVCLHNQGSRKVAVYAGKEDASYTSRPSVNGEERRHDMDLIFFRDDSTTMLALLPESFDRAALWYPAALRGWFVWLLAGLVLLAVPALLLRALQRASSASAQSN